MAKMKPKSNKKTAYRDLCQTPYYAIEPLLPYLSHKATYWDCSCGEGNLVKHLMDHDLITIGTDIMYDEKCDFLTMKPMAHDCIITNPPYSLKYKFLKRCYELGTRFALLMPVETLGAGTAQKLFKEYGIEIMFLDHRVNFKMPQKGWEGSAQFPTAWFCHGLLDSDPDCFRDVIVWGHIDPKGRKE